MTGFIQATKEQAKLRLAIFGPAGSGKTFSAMRIATGMAAGLGEGQRIAVIDTERGSASKYAGIFDFDILELVDDKSMSAYLKAIEMASDAGYQVLIIDSLSHAWQELLTEID